MKAITMSMCRTKPKENVMNERMKSIGMLFADNFEEIYIKSPISGQKNLLF